MLVRSREQVAAHTAMDCMAVVNHIAGDYMAVQRTVSAVFRMGFAMVAVAARHIVLVAIHMDFVVAAAVVDSDRYT